MKKVHLLFWFCMLFAFACSKDASTPVTGKSGSITRFAVHQGYMYTLNLNEVLTYSLEDPDRPELVNRLSTDYGLETIIFYDNVIYLGSTTALYILDISIPAAPSIISKTEREITFLGGCDPVVVNDNYAYSTIKIIQNACGSVSAESALLVYDISNKSAPISIGRYLLNIPNGLGYSDHYLFVCDEGSDRLEVFDITDPFALQHLTSNGLDMTDPYDLIVAGTKMIVSTKTDFQIFDISELPVLKRTGVILK